MKIKCKNWRPGLPTFRFAQAKLDGIWLSAFWSRDGKDKLCLHTSNPTDLVSQLDWWPTLYSLREKLGSRTVLHGELHVPGKPASYVKTAIKEGDRQLEFTVFAVENPDLRDDAPMIVVEEYAKVLGLGFARWDLPRGRSVDELYAYLNSRTDARIEGVVFKNGNLLDWHKWKPTPTVDCVVTGTKPGKGKYLGLVGALEASVVTAVHDGMTVTRPVAWVSGMTDDDRRLMTEHDPTGRVVEVAYQYVGSQGRLRHPRFVWFRDDKLADDCTEDQLV